MSREIRLRCVVPTGDAPLVFKKVIDFGHYPSVSPDVRSVVVHPGHTSWEVNFRRGIMCWDEREEIDTKALTVEFAQIDGDFDDFRGRWALTPGDDTTEVLFEVFYDFGIESLAGIMDPLAERVIKRAICAVLVGIEGRVDVVEGGSALTDLGELPPESGIRIVEGRS